METPVVEDRRGAFSTEYLRTQTNVFIDALLTSKLIDERDLGTLQARTGLQTADFFTALISTGRVQEKHLLKLASRTLEYEFCSSSKQIELDASALDFLSLDYLQEHALAPLQFKDGRRLFLTSNPFQFEQFRTLEFCLEEAIEPIHCARAQILEALDAHMRLNNSEARLLDTLDGPEADLINIASTAPVVRFVQDTFAQAIEQSASDIHFETDAKSLIVRNRINGALAQAKQALGLNSAAILSRLKVLADLNISERRKPQDGRISFKYGNRTVDLRLSTLPTQHGESAVVRILDQTKLKLDWTALGFEQNDIAKLKEIIALPSGLILITGPTGSGKTTTLYTALSDLNRPDIKLFTVEDPIEYELPGVTQIQVNAAIGFDFGTALRSILRQDPNVIMVGEIRDLETAEIACRAALVGRLVFATLHTSTAQQAVTRLKDLGVPQYLLEATMKAVVAQSLENVQCVDCRGKGCEACANSGSEKRRLSYEIYIPNLD